MNRIRLGKPDFYAHKVEGKFSIYNFCASGSWKLVLQIIGPFSRVPLHIKNTLGVGLTLAGALRAPVLPQECRNEPAELRSVREFVLDATLSQAVQRGPYPFCESLRFDTAIAPEGSENGN